MASRLRNRMEALEARNGNDMLVLFKEYMRNDEGEEIALSVRGPAVAGQWSFERKLGEGLCELEARAKARIRQDTNKSPMILMEGAKQL